MHKGQVLRGELMGKEKTVSAKGTVRTATQLPNFVARFRLQFFQLAFCFA
jgi:hypothetical protein